MSNDVTVNAYAKINFALDVLRRREDGYHDVSMIMQTVELHDVVNVKKIDSDNILIKSNSDEVLDDNTNLAYKAAELMKKNYCIKSGVMIEIDKNIPVAAGLAGGSSDAAAVIKAMNILFELGLSKDELCLNAKSIGADVPFCVIGNTALAEGIGEKLTPFKSKLDCFVLLAKPNLFVSTAQIYKAFDFKKVEKKPDINKMMNFIISGNLDGTCELLSNVLESVTIPLYPIVGDIKNELLSNSNGVLMSGSGPTVFALFNNENDCKFAELKIKEKFNLKEVYTTKVFNNVI